MANGGLLEQRYGPLLTREDEPLRPVLQLGSVFDVGQGTGAILSPNGQCSVFDTMDHRLYQFKGIRNLRTSGVNTCLAVAAVHPSDTFLLTHTSTAEEFRELFRRVIKPYMQIKGKLHACTPSPDVQKDQLRLLREHFEATLHCPEYMDAALRIPRAQSGPFQVVAVGKDIQHFDDHIIKKHA